MSEQVPAWQELSTLIGGHFSATQLTMAERCPEQYRRRYLLGEKERPGASLIWGRADHKAHEHNFQQKIESHEDVPVHEVEEVFADTFDTALEEAGGELEVEWGKTKPHSAKDTGVKLVALYHQQISPKVQPIAVEENFEILIPDVPIPVIGYIDVETDLSIIERKTVAASITAAKPDWRLQGRIYQEVKEKPVEWHLAIKTGSVATSHDNRPGLRLDPGEFSRRSTEEYVRRITEAIFNCYYRYGKDEPWPGALSHPWACSYCAWKPTCPWWTVEHETAA